MGGTNSNRTDSRTSLLGRPAEFPLLQSNLGERAHHLLDRPTDTLATDNRPHWCAWWWMGESAVKAAQVRGRALSPPSGRPLGCCSLPSVPLCSEVGRQVASVPFPVKFLPFTRAASCEQADGRVFKFKRRAPQFQRARSRNYHWMGKLKNWKQKYLISILK